MQALSADDEYDELRQFSYEYVLVKWLSRGQSITTTFEKMKRFSLNLLKMESRWKIEPISLRRNEFSVKRQLHFHPTKSIPNWSITINVADMIAGDNRSLGRNRIKTRGPQKEFLKLTATNEKPFVEFEYVVKETEKMKLFSIDRLDYFCNIRINVTDCRNLWAYLNVSVDFTQPFSVSNVILENDEGKRVYFVFEALALQSSVFYKFFEDKDNLAKEGDHYIIKMEDTDIVGIIIILKLLTYKEKQSLDHSNVDRVLFMTKKWKFEMVLAACEKFLITYFKENSHNFTYLSHQYDMSQLQHVIWKRQQETKEKLRNLENRVSLENGGERRTPQRPSSVTRYLTYITSEKFDFPETTTTFSHEGNLKFNPGEKAVNFTRDWILGWNIRWMHNHLGSVYLSIGPNFPDGSRFSPLNWSVDFVLTVKFQGNQVRFQSLCIPNRQNSTYVIATNLENIENTNFNYTFKMEIKSIKGLRYFVNDSVRSFDTRSPSSDVVLDCEDKKLFANSRVLALHSDFFRIMLNRLDKQPTDLVEKLPVVTVYTANSKTVSRILNYVYNPKRKEIKPKHATVMIPSAEYYIFSRMANDCEQILIDSHYYSFGIRSLEYAINCNLPSYKKYLLRVFTLIHDLQSMKEHPEYQKVSQEAKLALNEAFMERL